MTIATETIDHFMLQQLAKNGAVRDVDVIGHAGRWSVVVKYDTSERALAARGGAVRTFRQFEALVNYLKGIGISDYRVNAADFDRTSTKTTGVQPHASALAKAHADWVREKVAKSLADPRPNIPHKQVMEDVQAIIEAKRKKHAAKTAS